MTVLFLRFRPGPCRIHAVGDQSLNAQDRFLQLRQVEAERPARSRIENSFSRVNPGFGHPDLSEPLKMPEMSFTREIFKESQSERGPSRRQCACSGLGVIFIPHYRSIVVHPFLIDQIKFICLVEFSHSRTSSEAPIGGKSTPVAE